MMTAAPVMYCRQCGYNLAALPESRCPECGQRFDPQNPRTFANRPPAASRLRWTLRIGIPLLLLAASAAGGYAWLQHDWQADENALKAAISTRPPSYPRTPLVGRARVLPDWLARVLGQSNQHLLNRVVRLTLKCHRLPDVEIQGVRNLHHLQDLTLFYVRLTDDRSSFLGDLHELRKLDLSGNSMMSNGTLAHLRGLRQLHTLALQFSHVSDDGLEHLGHLPRLEALDLSYTEVKGPGLRFLSPSVLKKLDLSETRLGSEAIEYVLRLSALEELALPKRAAAASGLLDLARLPRLRRLSLVGDSGGAVDVQGFRRLRPDVVVVMQ